MLNTLLWTEVTLRPDSLCRIMDRIVRVSVLRTRRKILPPAVLYGWNFSTVLL